MIRVVFKNLQRSVFLRQAVIDRIEMLMDKFPELKSHRFHAKIYSENKRTQPGPDVFGIKLFVNGKKFKSLVLEKKASNLYQAITDLHEVFLERLNRATDKARVRKIKQARRSISTVALKLKNSDT